MGIRGLTTFIQSRSHLYMDTYELHDTNLVLDGNSIACQLYRWHCPDSNDCFGGDYDRYGKVVLDFFQLLSDCNITPYVIFDGGYEYKKVATVISRMKNKITTAAALDTVSEGSISLFPLFLKDCFEEILTKIGVKKVRCDYEADSETANIARMLSCPVLSYDSDFFIFDVLYIPFKTLELKSKMKNVSNTKESYRYISCEVYRIEKFLNSYGGMDKSNLPILAVLLGNDYVRRSVFKLFFQNLKIQKCNKNQNEQQRRIKSLIVWLQNETKESAIKKVLSRYKKGNRLKVWEHISRAIQGYYCCDSKYLKYLGIDIKFKEKDNETNFTQFLNHFNSIEENESITDICEESEIDTEDSSSSDETFDDTLIGNGLNELDCFLENFRKCIYPPCFMDIVCQNRYYCIPQVENISLKHSHAISYEILSAIHKIMKGNVDRLICITRTNTTQVGKEFVTVCNKVLPHFTEMNSLSSKQRVKLLLQILEIEETFVSRILSLFPKPWDLLVITIKYLTDKSVISWPFIYSLVLCKLILEQVDAKVGFYRDKKLFDKKFSPKLKILAEKKSNTSLNETIIESLSDITYDDSLNILNKLLVYFKIEEKMKTHSRSFKRNLVHSISQFQSCLLHIKYLNCLLNYPLSDIIMSKTLNCTFVYNFTTNLTKRTNCDNYLGVLLGEGNAVLHSLKLIISKLKEGCQTVSIPESVSRKKRKKKKTEDSTVLQENVSEEIGEDEQLFDPNNKFSVLGI